MKDTCRWYAQPGLNAPVWWSVSLSTQPSSGRAKTSTGTRAICHAIWSCSKLEKVDLVWTPTAEEMYPPGFQTWVTVEDVTQPLEGSMRPGHFRGVATVVAKLFNAVQPDKAYFGQKDAQQAAVIRRMGRDLNFKLEVVICPTWREADGLAMSSRNVYLNPDERRAATILYKALTAAQAAYQAGERKAESLRQIMTQTIQMRATGSPAVCFLR